MMRPSEYDLKVGQRMRLPTGRIDRPICSFENPLYPYDCEIVAFRCADRVGMVLVRRLHDRIEKWLSERTLAALLDAPGLGRAAGEARRREAAKLRGRREGAIWREELAARDAGWRERPCYYTTVLNMNHTDYRALSGPFATYAAALLALPEARRLANASGDPCAAWYAYGTAKFATGACEPLFPVAGLPFQLAA